MVAFLVNITILANSRKEYGSNNIIIKKLKFDHVNNNVKKTGNEDSNYLQKPYSYNLLAHHFSRHVGKSE
jgi:hypothetical protein